MDNGSEPMIQLNEKPSRRSAVDRISKLPDSLLQHILTFVSTRDAIRTSILSLRWQNLWMLVPCLDLDTEQFSDEDDFFKFMGRILDLRGNSHLQKFKVKYNLFESRSSRFKSWIDAAIRCKAEHLDIESFFCWDHVCLLDDAVKTPQSLYICNTLVVLKLEGVFLHDVPKRVSLSNLKTLHLRNTLYADDIAFKNLISGCPVLEELNIYRDSEDNLEVLCICSPTLKQLIIYFSSCGCGREYGVEIDAPNLEFLKLDDQDTKSFIITQIGSSSLKACLNVGRYYRDELEADDFSMRSNICRLFTGISNARSLIIHLDTFKFLCHYRKFEALPQFHNLIHLEGELSKPACKMLPAILEFCPSLKILILRLYDIIIEPEPVFILESDPPRLSLAAPQPMSSSLEEIEPQYMLSSPEEIAPQPMLSSLESVTLRLAIREEATEINLIKYFLKSSVVLKELKVNLTKDPKREKELLMFMKFLKVARRSTTCQIYVE